jgi:transposase-like protein
VGRTGRWTGVYPVIFIDAIQVKVRDAKVANSADLRRARGDV